MILVVEDMGVVVVLVGINQVTVEEIMVEGASYPLTVEEVEGEALFQHMVEEEEEVDPKPLMEVEPPKQLTEAAAA